jgi:hypothetical protein
MALGFAKVGQVIGKLWGGRPEEAVLVPIEDPSMQEEFERSVCSELKSRYEKRKGERNFLELQWRLWSAFYEGDQYADIDPLRGTLVEVPLWSTYEERNVFNQVAPTIDTQLAEMNKRKNNMRVTPASSSSKDKAAARVGDRVVASMRRRLGMSELYNIGNMYTLILGSCVWKTVWDASAGKTIAYIIGEMTNEEVAALPPERIIDMHRMGYDNPMKVDKVHEGDVDVQPVSPFEIYPENLNVSCGKNRRIMHVKLLSPDEEEEKWGVRDKGEDNQVYKISNTEQPIYGGACFRAYGMTLHTETVKNTVRIYEEWELPTERYPHGRLMISSDNHLLHYGPLPDRTGQSGTYELPFDVQQSIRTDGFFGKSIIDRLIPAQRAYNANKNRIQDYLNRISIGNFAYVQNSIPEDVLNDIMDVGLLPGMPIPYLQGMDKPSFMQTPSLPPDIFTETKNLADDINTIAGVSALAKTSTVGSQIDSASALAGLASQDDTRIGLIVENAQQAYINSTRKALLLYRQNVKYPRIVGAIGKDETLDVMQFEGSDLTSFDIRIDSEPTASDTVQARAQNIIQMLNAGLFSDQSMTPDTREAIFDMLDMGDWYALMDPNNANQRKANRENHKMAIGEPAKILSFEDHLAHLLVHMNFQLTDEYEEAVKKDPGIAGMFEEHKRQHVQNYITLKRAAQQPDGQQPWTVTESEIMQSVSPQDQQAQMAAQQQQAQQGGQQ